jgi:hypothetical protein
MVTKNESSTDRDLRIVLGGVLMILAIFWLKGLFTVLVGLVALVLFVTAAVGFCPVYRVFGFSTTGEPKHHV